jgi:hypothetical protein
MSVNRIADTDQLLSLGLLLLIFVLGMGLRLYNVDATSLWGDELYTAARAQLDLRSMLENVSTSGDNPPLSFVLFKYSVMLMGDSDFAFRFPTAILGSLTILLTYKVGEMLWTRQVGLVGSFLLAVNAYHIRFSQFARHYSITVFLALVSLILLLKALQTGKKRFWLGFALASVLNLYNHYFAFLPLVSLTIFGFCTIAADWISRRNLPESASPRRQDLMLALSLCLIVLLFLPWLPSMLQHIYGPHVGWEGFDAGSMLRIQRALARVERWLIKYSGLDTTLALLAFALAVLGIARSTRSHALLIGLWLGVPLVFALNVTTDRSAGPAYSMFVVPIYLLAVARGGVAVASLLERPVRRIVGHPRWVPLITVVIVVLAFAALSVAPLRAYHLERVRVDWRGAAQYLADNLMPQDMVLADGVGYTGGQDSFRVRMGLSHYLSAQGARDTPLLDVGLGLWEDLATTEQGQGRAWAVLWYSARADSWEGTQHANIVDFPGVLVIRPTESSGDTLQNAASTLESLLEVMPTEEGRFDVHLALADIYLRASRFEEAHSQLQQASAIQPDHSRAFDDMRKATVDFFESAYPVQIVGEPLWPDFGEVVALLGYDVRISTEGPNRLVDLTLWWGTLEDMDKDYTAFIHVVDQEGQILAQEDRLLQQGDRPTSEWLVGSVARKQHQLQLGLDTTPADCLIRVGLYNWETGERLPAQDQQGHRLSDDTIVMSIVG